MLKTNLKILALSIIVLGFYTMIASVIPQLQSEVPETLDLSSGVTPALLSEAGERLYLGAGACTSCHGLGTRAPNLLSDHAGQGTIGMRCGSRKPGMDCKAYLYESLTQPAVYLVDGFPAIMLSVSNQLSDDQIWAIVAYLQGQGGEITVTAPPLRHRLPGPVSRMKLTQCSS
jgi:mono/diheme cytochrome c family protein